MPDPLGLCSESCRETVPRGTRPAKMTPSPEPMQRLIKKHFKGLLKRVKMRKGKKKMVQEERKCNRSIFFGSAAQRQTINHEVLLMKMQWTGIKEVKPWL